MDSPTAKGDQVFPAPSITTTILVTVALYNVLELLIIMFAKFRPLHGLYFYSFLASTLGVAVYLFGIMLKTYRLSNEILLFSTLLIIGWIPMVTGQALVLYSRLGLLVPQRKVMKAVLIMIIITGTVAHVPIVAMIYGAASSRSLAWALALIDYEKVQSLVFFLQSTLISALYIWHSIRMLRFDHDAAPGTLKRTTLIKLVILNFVWVLLEMTIVVVEWKTRITTSAVYNATAHSVVLKLEWEMLNQLPASLSPSSSSIQRISSPDLEKNEHPSPERKSTASFTQERQLDDVIRLHTFNGRTQIISPSQFNADSDFPANEAYKSPLNDTVTPVVRAKSRRSIIQQWNDSISGSVDDEDDLESFYVRSRRTMSDVGGGTGLTPSPVFRKGSI